MNSRSESLGVPVYVLAICAKCKAVFAEPLSDFYAREGPNREQIHCISCDQKAEAERITLTAKGFEEANKR